MKDKNTQLKNFVFTCHILDKSYEEQEQRIIETLKQNSSHGIKYIIMGREKGGEGNTPHLQGYCMLNDRISWNKLTKLLTKVHIEIPKGTPYHNYVYCSKEGNVVVEEGERPVDGRPVKIDYKRIIKHSKEGNMLALEDEFPRVFFANRSHIDKLRIEGNPPGYIKRRGLYLVGSPRTGKSRFANTIGSPFTKAPNKWWCGYTNQDTVIFEDLDHSNCKSLSWWLKYWLDGQPRSGETKNGNTWLLYDTFVVTSNYRPETLFGDDIELIKAIKGRFKVVVVLDHRVSPIGQVEIKTPDPDNPMLVKWYNQCNIFSDSDESE